MHPNGLSWKDGRLVFRDGPIVDQGHCSRWSSIANGQYLKEEVPGLLFRARPSISDQPLWVAHGLSGISRSSLVT